MIRLGHNERGESKTWKMLKEITTMMMDLGVCISVWVLIIQNPMSINKARRSA